MDRRTGRDSHHYQPGRSSNFRTFRRKSEQARQGIELITGAAPEFDQIAFLAGQQTPVFFGSAINNFGVQEVLDTLAGTGATARITGPSSAKFSLLKRNFPAWFSRFRPNMNPAHRDRLFRTNLFGEFRRE
ncbi:MAG: hypothetical protein P0107_01760 [Nitrosomonas sp.]|nr:hypothetical protein [Nitrosomonas sp.]